MEDSILITIPGSPEINILGFRMQDGGKNIFFAELPGSTYRITIFSGRTLDSSFREIYVPENTALEISTITDNFFNSK
jgi:hypothetical protein